MATMLDCKKIQPLLSEYVDGTLPDQSAWDVKMHVTSCAVCSQVARELTATANLLSSLPTLEPSANFEAMLAKRLADQVLSPRKPTFTERLRNGLTEWWARPLVRPAVATGVVFATLLPVAVLMTQTGPSTTIAAVMSPSPTPTQVANQNTDNSAGTMDELYSDHLSYTTSEPLGASAGYLAASNGSGTGNL
jgi:anti-sigma factor RsiW